MNKFKLGLAIIIAILFMPIIASMVWLVIGTGIVFAALNYKKIQAFIGEAKEIASGKSGKY